MSNPKKIEAKFANASQVPQYYLPFLKNGGFFFNTDFPFQLNDLIILEITLPDGDPTPIKTEGRVALITAKTAETIHHITDHQGIGVAIEKEHHLLQTRINALLRMHEATTRS
ncbi:hypothetical protein [Ignatzschineria cameli]|uniref:PilZ domain-containing protein n=1 Tax=Ignatzschineria cameli TaxID=2182793 RepID=A0A2U2AR38_9GAMM|nr:hypothetical protein [Ignatzschineria cameli]PWD85246.1 hypothetical protein DC080_06195 [Ignatzschineria cameli]PWD86329.1 hypothetical protein DC077_06200 [Ignatzschineria cameli]PWD89833.1 hypothetical protein DC079_05730 [Ignatzschineria cameli]PWD91483.1 hypothetical protein DC081_05440 [Ignatzschineria cameli]PWD92521.1 hypothetical protein DC078_05725 [Ignatzschineria cameli]